MTYVSCFYWYYWQIQREGMFKLTASDFIMCTQVNQSISVWRLLWIFFPVCSPNTFHVLSNIWAINEILEEKMHMILTIKTISNLYWVIFTLHPVRWTNMLASKFHRKALKICVDVDRNIICFMKNPHAFKYEFAAWQSLKCATKHNVLCHCVENSISSFLKQV